jgi:hypothetical protein
MSDCSHDKKTVGRNSRRRPAMTDATPEKACPFKVGDRIQLKHEFGGIPDAITITAVDEAGASYKGATPLSIPRMGIQGDGTGKIFPSAYGYYELAPTPPAPAGLHEKTKRLLELREEWLHCLTTIGLRCPKEDNPTIEELAAHLAALDAALKACEEDKKYYIDTLCDMTKDRDRLQRENEELRDATILLQTARDDAYEERDALYDAFSELAKLVKQDDGADPETFWIELDRDQAQMIREVAKKAAALNAGRERT